MQQNVLAIKQLDALICDRLTGHADKLLSKMNNMEKERPKHLLPKYAMGPEMRHRMKMMRRMDPELMHMYMEEVLNGERDAIYCGVPGSPCLSQKFNRSSVGTVFLILISLLAHNGHIHLFKSKSVST